MPLWSYEVQTFADKRRPIPRVASCFAIQRNEKTAVFTRSTKLDLRFNDITSDQWLELFKEPDKANKFFPGLIKISEPAYTAMRTKPATIITNQRIAAQPTRSFVRFRDRIAPNEWEEAALSRRARERFIYSKGRYVNIGVYVFSEYRGKGYAPEIVQNLTNIILLNEPVAIYRYSAWNLPSASTGHRIGFELYGKTLQIDLSR
jgi:RimJ/RimL family protein N-acetyltransferase